MTESSKEFLPSSLQRHFAYTLTHLAARLSCCPAPMRMPLHVCSVPRIRGLQPDAIDNENGHCSGHSQTKATCRAVSRELPCVWVGSHNPPGIAHERIAEPHCKCGDGLLRHHLDRSNPCSLPTAFLQNSLLFCTRGCSEWLLWAEDSTRRCLRL